MGTECSKCNCAKEEQENQLINLFLGKRQNNQNNIDLEYN